MDEDRLKRHDLSDAEWARLEPLLPRHPRQGHRWNDHRLVIDGIFFRSRTGCPWRDLPERFGIWKTVYNRHRRWSGDGTWEMILARLRAGCDEAEGQAWTVAADATVVRAHQHAAGARRHAGPTMRATISPMASRIVSGGRSAAGLAVAPKGNTGDHAVASAMTAMRISAGGAPE